MPFTSKHVSIEGIDKPDTEQKDWKSACNELLSKEGTDALDAVITPHAFKHLVLLKQTISYLYKMISQQLCHTPVFVFDTETQAITRTTDKKYRKNLEEHFQNMKKYAEHNKILQEHHISGRIEMNVTDYRNLSIIFTKFSETAKYISYQKIVQTDGLEKREVYLFYHKILKLNSFVITPPTTPEITQVLQLFMIKNAILLSMEKICANCGRCAEDLMDCSGCKATRYCNADCQKNHWSASHKSICQKRRALLNLRKEKIQAMCQRQLRTCMKVWKARHSFPDRPRMECATECAAEDTDALEIGDEVCELEKSDEPEVADSSRASRSMSMVALETLEIDDCRDRGDFEETRAAKQ